MERKKSNRCLLSFCLISVLLFVVFSLFCIFSKSLLPIIPLDPENYFMDFFIINRSSIKSYAELQEANPPFVHVLGLFFSMFADYKNIDIYSIAKTIPGIISYILFILIPVIVIYICTFFYIKKEKRVSSSIMVMICFFLSNPFLYFLLRGNYVIYALMFSILFFFFYRINKKYSALVFLACAAAIKIYPLLFALIFIKQKEYKEFILTIVLVLIISFLSFAILPGHFNNIPVFITNFFKYIGSPNTYLDSTGKLVTFNVSHELSLKSFLAITYSMFTRNNFIYIYSSKNFNLISFVFSLILFAILIVTFFKTRKKHLEYLVLTLGIILLPSPSFCYVGIFLFIPLFSISNESQKTNKHLYKYYLLLFLLMAPFYFGYIFKPGERDLAQGASICNYLQTFIMILIIPFSFFYAIKE